LADLAETLIEEMEGLQLTAYEDVRRLWTIGYGHLLDQTKDWTGYTITQDQAEAWLAEDMTRARGLAAGFPYFSQLGDVRQGCLVSMCFQLGAKPLYWPNFMAALEAKDYAAAATAGRDSDWWRWQTPKRAELEMTMLQSGQWIGD
jgi:GH24 family phage-related lysozyme (muramidase)